MATARPAGSPWDCSGPGGATWRWPAGTGAGGFAANVLANFVIGTLFALGEELGWRGYLLPRLLGLGRARALLLSGFLHGVWHLPVILLTTSYHSEGNRLAVLPLFLATLTVPTSALWMEYLSGESGAITLVLAIVAVTILYCKDRASLLKERLQTFRPGLTT